MVRFPLPVAPKPPRRRSTDLVNLALLLLEFIGRPFFYVVLVSIILPSLVGSSLLRLTSLLLRITTPIKLLTRIILTILEIIGNIALKLPIIIVSVFSTLTKFWKKAKRPSPKQLALIKTIKIYPRLFPKLPKFKFPKLKITFHLPTVRKIRPLRVICLSLAIAIPITTAAIAFWFIILKDLPSPKVLLTRPQALTTRIFDRNGRLLYKFYKNENRTLVPLSEIPLTLRQATIAIEDKEFYSHPGVSFRGITRSFLQNLSTGSLSGGSTITQQLVKNTLLSPEKTWTRKIKEAVLALEVEFSFTKDQILEMYLNEVPYGGSTYGVAEASEFYFGKRVQDLNLTEVSFLAGLPSSPTKYSPYGEHPELASIREREVLTRMVLDGYITQASADSAIATDPILRSPNIDIIAPHFVMYVKQLLDSQYGEGVVEQSGLQVYTSLDPDIQDLAQKTLTSEVDKVHFLRIGNGATIVTNPQTGEILAMVGSRDYFDTQNQGNVNATLALRQPGSSIKPVNYAVALENGFTPATIIPDTPITFRIPGQPPYSPVNYDGRYHGNVTLRTALASSYNVPAVKVLSAIGVNRMIEMGQKMGITTWNDPSRFGLSLTLGGGEVRMIDLSTVYGTLANIGQRVDLHPILRVDDSRGHTLENYTCTDAKIPAPTITNSFLINFPNTRTTISQGCEKERVLDPRVAYILTDILSDNSARTPAFGSHSDLFIPDHQVAVKTGTTNNLKDNWTIGYTPNLLVAVWVGNFDSSPMSNVASGVTGASPIWNKIMTALLKNHPSPAFSPPGDLIKLEICATTGTLPCDACPNKRTEYFLPDTAPTQACTDEMLKPTPSPTPRL